ncbi:cation transporter [Pararhodospirillum photometricum]|uniref:Heavy metal translocating P-type ATPase n=1 Tax=Pararhodospirillum photometricum DSM 122 TaxID=1150469 RepID=H6SPQ1_PARPM|nr:cation transporter [Pararhodospirillum photometricum]CCG07171.1 Heavy metal translocating P-type ATPase [Pararhodospirillum photometricum DSM 122]
MSTELVSSPPQTVDLVISGMSCAACSTRLERVLGKVPGVSEASVNLATERARVVVAGGAARLDDLVAAVTGAGFGARLADDRPEPSRDASADGFFFFSLCPPC